MNNPPAFPSFDYITQEGRENPKGMTLRDYFAAQAMQAFIQAAFDGHTTLDYVDVHAYKMADQMLKERES
jgi:hypothetical protein